MKRLGFLTGIACVLIGCGTSRIPYPTQTSQNATIKLAEAAESVSHSFVELSRIQHATTPVDQSKQLPDPDTFGMQGTASIDWSGPIEPLLQSIANASRFKLRILGKKPVIPIIVSHNVKNIPLAHIVRDIDYIAGNRAHIVVFPKEKVIELRYARG